MINFTIEESKTHWIFTNEDGSINYIGKKLDPKSDEGVGTIEEATDIHRLNFDEEFQKEYGAKLNEVYDIITDYK